MIEVIITGLLAVIGNVIVSLVTHHKTSAVMAYRMDELEKKMDKHNQLIERVYLLEQNEAVTVERLKVINHRIEDLEEKHA